MPSPDHPIAFHYRGEPIPDLSRIEPGRWRAALEPLTEEGRRQACNTAGHAVLDARGVAIELALDGADRRAELAETIERSAALATPTQLARIFIVNGTRRALHDHA